MIRQRLSSIPYTSVLHVVIGAFDGVHLGHQQLIQFALEQARVCKEISLIFSFDPIPKAYFLKEKFHGYLLSSHKREEILEYYHADYTIIAPFEDIKNYSEQQFMEILLSKADKVILYSGKDFRLGTKESSPYQGDKVQRVLFEEVTINKERCHSANIRELLQQGEVSRANALLNREYCITSYTVPGNKIGRTIDFPTINIQPNQQITPQSGVYFGTIKIFQKTYPAAVYVGRRPTVYGVDLRIESHIIEDFPYPEVPSHTPAEVSFIQKIGEEKSFNSLEELKEMLYNYKRISSALATERYQYQKNRQS